MHTSKLLHAEDFQYWRLHRNTPTAIDFAAFCPHYHTRDRIGIVSPHLEDGIYATGSALLALTTAFYDVLRSRSDTFYDYPHHFALLGSNDQGVRTRRGWQRLDTARLGAAWGALDVWPASQWILAPGTAAGMLQTACHLQLNRLFWPEDLGCAPEQTPWLPWYTRDLLRARLEGVYYYNAATPNVAICSTKNVADIIQTSVSRLPTATAGAADLSTTPEREMWCAEAHFPHVEPYRQAEVEAFLDSMAACFQPRP